MAQPMATSFDDPKADLQFITSNGVLLRVHSTVLSLVEGSIFADMLSRALDDGQPIPVTEDSSSFSLMLRSIYPAPDLAFDDLDTIFTILPLAQKYQLETITARCVKALASPELLKRDPYGVFAVAYKSELKEIVKIAAKATLGQPPSHYNRPPKFLQHIPATALFSLIQYHEACQLAVCDNIEKRLYIEHARPGTDTIFSDMGYSCDSCSKAPYGSEVQFVEVDGYRYFEYALGLMKRTPSPDAINADGELASTAFVKGKTECPSCHLNIVAIMESVRWELGGNVENVISSVPLTLLAALPA